jgi:hypothetical protein
MSSSRYTIRQRSKQRSTVRPSGLRRTPSRRQRKLRWRVRGPPPVRGLGLGVRARVGVRLVVPAGEPSPRSGARVCRSVTHECSRLLRATHPALELTCVVAYAGRHRARRAHGAAATQGVPQSRVVSPALLAQEQVRFGVGQARGGRGLYRIGKWPIKRHLRTIRQ